jgi:hypothetical protein
MLMQVTALRNCMQSCRLNACLKKGLVFLLWVLSSTHFMNPIPVEATPVMHVGPRIVSIERITCKDSLRVKIYTQNLTHCKKTGCSDDSFVLCCCLLIVRVCRFPCVCSYSVEFYRDAMLPFLFYSATEEYTAYLTEQQ